MEGNLIQKKYYDREHFTLDEKEDICAKSGNKCAHCGTPIFAGYQMTVDHFIPLDKGGSNQMINLIPLCKDCNETKDNKLYSMEYIKYLKPKYKQQIKDYLDSYVQVIDYCQRHRLLAYDEYNRSILITPRNVRRKNKSVGVKSKYILKYATWDDLDKITDYLIRYLKKNEVLDSEEAARENIIFWMQFGCIYYVERNGEVTTMIAMTIKQLGEDQDYRGIYNQPMMYLFPYYQTEISEQIVLDLIYDIPKLICDENNLSFMPLNIVMLEGEKMKNVLSYMYKTSPKEDNVEGFIVFHVLVGENESYDNVHIEYEDMNESEKKTHDFFNKFNDVTDKMLRYFEKYEDRESVSWMINSILSVKAIKESKLSKYISFDNGGE